MLKVKTLTFCMFFMTCLFGQSTVFEAEHISLREASKALEKEFHSYDLYRLNYNALQEKVVADGDDINFSLKLGDQYLWDLYLYPKDIRGTDYNVYVQTENGVEIQPRRPNMTYRGHLKSRDGGGAAFTINDHHFAGTIRKGDEVFFIEPLHYLIKNAPKDIVVVYKMSEVIPDGNLKCGADEVLENQLHESERAHKHDHDHDHAREGGARDGLCLEVDLAIASDWQMYLDYNQSVTDVEDHNITVMNNVAANWDDEFDDEIVFVIVTQFVSTCNTCDPWTTSTNAETLLISFRNWGNGGGFGVPFDLGQLWTDRNLNGGTVGIAYVSGVCTNSRYHVVQDFTTNQERLRVMTAHEIGHNFGSFHDAANSGFIMQPSVSTSTIWSANSQNVISNLIENRYNQGCFAECANSEPPAPNFTADQTSGCVPFIANFTDLSTNEPTSWSWSFPGGTPATSTEQNPSVTYTSAGFFDVTLTASNGAGSNTITQTAYISAVDVPETSFNYFTTDDLVIFTNTSQNALSYFWDFGDGNSSTEENPSHTYAEDGSYTVTLTASNACGINVSTQLIEVATLPIPNFTADVTSGCAPLVVVFEDLSSSNTDFWIWEFPGASPDQSTVQNPTVLYENPGTYDVTLTVVNEVGSNTFTMTGYITVYPLPTPSYTYTVNGTTVDFTNTSIDADSYSWDFGDGNTSTEENPSYTYAGGGSYLVELTATNDCGEQMVTEEIVIATAPVANFSADTTSGCIPLTVQFTDESAGADTWEWTFEGGNPDSSTEQNPMVVYENTGSYDVTLIVTNAIGADTLTLANYITVNDVPVASFTSSTNGTTVDFTNTSTNADSYSWDFGDGNTSTEESPSHTYAGDGTYTVVLTATNECGSVTSEEEITITTVPDAGFSANVLSGCADLTVQFSDESTANATSWEWTFEGGNPSSSTEQNPTVVYENAGTYDVTLEVSNAAGSNTTTESNYITVNDVPTSSFTSSTNGTTVDFTNTSTNADSYSWDFGDGNTSTEESPSHTYAGDGTYTVVLTATNECGSVTSEEEITITTVPDAGFSANVLSGCADLTVQFSDESTANATSWEWTFEGGNPSSSTEQNPTVVYENAGTYDVTLEVSNAAGSNTTTETNYITVDDVPNASFTSSINNSTANFTNTSTNADSYSWDFGDGNTSTEESPSHTYANDGEYVVILSATNTCGTVTSTQTINIGTLPTAGFGADVTSGCAPLTVQFADQSSANTTSWAWTFAGGTPATSTQQNPEVIFEQAGTYTVTLTVSNTSGSNTSTQTDYISVTTVPTVGFGVASNGTTANFTNTSTNADSYAWDFGDGNGSTETSPSHTYASDGIYTVMLTATNECGSNTSEQEVTIVTAPMAGFSANVQGGCADLTVQFSDASTTNATSWLWTFEGGIPSSSTEENPTVVYNTEGSYEVQLEVSNAAGSNTAVEQNYIVVNDVPNASFTIASAGAVVAFTNTSTNGDSYLWDFGDGTTSTEENPNHNYIVEGDYEVSLTVTNTCGTDTATQTVTAIVAPVAGFTSNTTSGCAPLTVQFSNQSTGGTADVFNWSFPGGNPSSSTEENPTVTYANAGSYSVELQVSNSAGSNTATQTDYITVNTLPSPSFTGIITGTGITFTNTSSGATGFSWDFGDGASNDDTNPSHEYDEDGMYTVTLTAENGCGTATYTETFEIITTPLAGFTADVTTGCTGLMVNFMDMSSDNTDSWMWTFEGGSPSSSMQENPTVVYNTPGSYTVTLVATTAAGSNTFTQNQFIVVNTVPNAGFSSTINGATVNFLNNTTGATTYLWNFGDGNTSTIANPEYTYSEDGDYSVTLTASNACGETTMTQNISVVSFPSAAFQADVTTACGPFDVNFSDASTGNVSSWSWTFSGGNPATSSDQNPTVNYSIPGTYSVILEVSNAAGTDTETVTGYIVVEDIPQADFSTTVTGATSIFTNTGSGGTSYAWDFGDGNTSMEENPFHAYSMDGTYTVSLTVTNSCGMMTIEKEVMIITPPSAFFSADTTSGCAPFTVQYMDQSTDNTASRFWTFAGGTPATSTDENPVVTYNTAGTYDVTLTVTNAAGNNTAMESNYIVIGDVPTVDFTNTVSGATASFSNQSTNGTTYDWDFGDGNSSSLENPNHQYPLAGDYQVTLTVSNACGSSSNMQTVSIVGVAPTAAFMTESTTGCLPHTVNFEDQSTGDPVEWAWSFPGGNPSTSTDQNPSVVFENVGTYEVSLTVTNDFGENTLVEMSYIVVEDVPAADFDYQDPVIDGLAVFTNNSTGATSYSWDFGDGEPVSTEENPEYQYGASGVYTVTLTATNACGSTTYEEEINVVVSSLEDFENLNTFELYPNPNSGQFVLVLEGEAINNLEFRLFNVLGQGLHTEVLDFVGGRWTKDFNFKDLASGTYIVQLRSEGKLLYKKLMIE